MAIYLKLSAILTTLVVLSAYGPIERSDASPLSVRNMREFLKSLLQLASSQNEHHMGPTNAHRYVSHRANARRQEKPEHPSHHPTTVRKESLSDELRALLQDMEFENDTIDNNSTEGTEGGDNTTESSRGEESKSEKTGLSGRTRSSSGNDGKSGRTWPLGGNNGKSGRGKDIDGGKSGRPCNHDEPSEVTEAPSEVTEPTTTEEVPNVQEEFTSYQVNTPDGHPFYFVKQEGHGKISSIFLTFLTCSFSRYFYSLPFYTNIPCSSFQ